MEEILDSLKFISEKVNSEFNEESSEFAEFLHELKIERDVIAISNSYEKSKEFFPLHKEIFDKYYTFIDKVFYDRISKILSDYKNLVHIDEVCLILKIAYYRVLVSLLNDLPATNADRLKKIFSAFLELLEKETQIIKFHTLKDGSYEIKEPIVIKYIQKVLIENIKGYFEHIDYSKDDIYPKELGKKSHSETVLEDCIYESTHQLLNCLIITGEEQPFFQTINREYSNKQLLVAFKLLEAVRLVDSDSRKNDKISKAFRQRISRRHEKEVQEMLRSEHYKLFLEMFNKLRPPE